jgi:cytoskeleton protein RodZ
MQSIGVGMADEVVEEAELPLDNVGARLRRAREAKGLGLAQVAAKTRIPERLLDAIEQGNFSALPARAYAVGFSRSYAVGLDDLEIAEAVRSELAEQYVEPPRRVPSFEPGDPARVPPSRLAWLAGLAALALLIAGLFFWRSYFLPGGELPSILPQEAETPASVPSAQAPQPPASGPVVFTALADGVWVKFYDGTGTQLMQKQMASGESWTVPGDVPGVRIWTARPDQLAITIGGQPVPPLSDFQRTMKDVPVDAASLLARGAAPAAAAPRLRLRLFRKSAVPRLRRWAIRPHRSAPHQPGPPRPRRSPCAAVRRRYQLRHRSRLSPIPGRRRFSCRPASGQPWAGSAGAGPQLASSRVHSAADR